MYPTDDSRNEASGNNRLQHRNALLRVSDFCRRSDGDDSTSGGHRLAELSGADNYVENDKIYASGTVVQLRILSQHQLNQIDKQRRHQKIKPEWPNSDWNTEDDRIVYASNINLLYKVSVTCNSWICVTRRRRRKNIANDEIFGSGNDELSNDNADWMTHSSLSVRVQLLPFAESNDDTNESDIIYINQIMAVNLGWIDLTNVDYDGDDGQFDFVLHRFKECTSQLQFARAVTLQIVARPRWDHDSVTCNDRYDACDDENDDQSDQYDDDYETNGRAPLSSLLDSSIDAWTFPKPGTCLQVGALVATKMKPTKYDRNRFEFSFYYQVTQIETDSSGYKANDDVRPPISWYGNERRIIISSSKTRYRLEAPAPYITARLPPLYLAPGNVDYSRNFGGDDDESSIKGSIDNLERRRNLLSSQFLPHPDTCTFLKAFYSQQRFLIRSRMQERYSNNHTATTAASSLTMMMTIHAVGTTYDHHCINVIKSAANYAGRNCIIVQGLSAYAYLSALEHTKREQKHRRQEGRFGDLVESADHPNGGAISSKDDVNIPLPAQAKNTGTTMNMTGSIVDKIAGVRAALEEACSHAPCVLVLMDFDKEFHSTDDDNDMETDVHRIWTVLDEYYSKCQSKQNNLAENFHASNLGSVPAVTVILNTSRSITKLQQQHMRPLAQQIQQRCSHSIHFSKPDSCYIQFLWEQTKRDNRLLDDNRRDGNDMSGVRNSTLPLDLMEKSLKGRAANEITQLLNDFISRTIRKNRENESSSTLGCDNNYFDYEMFRSICTRRDASQRHKKSGLAHVPSTRWEDVGGLAHVRQEIMDAIELPLNYPHLFTNHDSQGGAPALCSTTGILLYGPPGTGKTLVAKAVATECQLPFLSVKGPELLGSYVGESEANVRAIFIQARELARQNQTKKACILFFDELDSLAPRRGDSASGGNVMDRVVATLFSELDGGSSGESSAVDGESACDNNNSSFLPISIFCIGATNRPDLLDPALLRPGRLDRLVYLGLSPSDRASILMAQIRKLRLAGDAKKMVDAVVPNLPMNMTGADMSTVASGAMLRATERLCREADKQFLQLQNDYPQRHNSVDEILATWGKDQLTPVVTVEDLLAASLDVAPSVDPSELVKYEQMSERYRMTN